MYLKFDNNTQKSFVILKAKSYLSNILKFIVFIVNFVKIYNKRLFEKNKPKIGNKKEN